jgi:hypothetical protein
MSPVAPERTKQAATSLKIFGEYLLVGMVLAAAASVAIKCFSPQKEIDYAIREVGSKIFTIDFLNGGSHALFFVVCELS